MLADLRATTLLTRNLCRCGVPLLLVLAGLPARAQQITFVETDTAGTTSVGCSSLTAATTQVDLQMVKSGTVGSATQSPNIQKNSTHVAITWIAPAGSPGALFWPGGQASGNEWSVSIDVTTANSFLSWTELDICADNGGTFSTIKSDTSLNISLGTTGVKTQTETVTSGTAEGSGVIPFIVIGVHNSKNNAAESFSFLSNQNILSPLVTSPTFIQGAGNLALGVTSTHPAAFTVTGSNTIIACAREGNATQTMSVSDSLSNSYKVANTIVGSGTNTNTGECWFAQNSASGSDTVTVSVGSSTNLEIEAGEWSYVDPSSPAFICNNGAAGNSASLDSGACVAPSNGVPALLAGFGWLNSGTPTVGSGWTSRVTSGNGAGIIEDRVVSSAGSTDATFSGTSNVWVAIVLGLSQYGAAPPPSCPKGMLAMMGVGCGD